MEFITIWGSKLKKAEKFEHNHIEFGLSKLDIPAANSVVQKNSWPNKIWKKNFGLLILGIVFEII